MRVEIIGAVVAQGRPKLTSRPYPHAYDPAKSRNFKAVLAYQAQEELKRIKAMPFEGAVRLEIYVYMAIPQSWSKKKQQEAREWKILPAVKPDADNISKSIMDSLSGIWYLDDKQVSFHCVVKRYAPDGIPRFIVFCMEDSAGTFDECTGAMLPDTPTYEACFYK